MRLIATADLHFNHPRSRALAEDVIAQMNRAGGDVLLVVGDTASFDSDVLEQCLSLFQFDGPKLFVAGNHELWTSGPDSAAIYAQLLPQRVRALGWQWLEAEPFVADDVAIVGNVGWYDFSFAQPSLGIPPRFYQSKISPGVAVRFAQYAHLEPFAPDVSAEAREIFARWNDGRFVKLHQSDAAFLEAQLSRLKAQLDALSARRVVAAVHHLPFCELLPPPHNAQWDFAKAYLGSQRLGELLMHYPNVSHVLCGHSHMAVEAKVGQIHAINIGSGYRWKTYRELDL